MHWYKASALVEDIHVYRGLVYTHKLLFSSVKSCIGKLEDS